MASSEAKGRNFLEPNYGEEDETSLDQSAGNDGEEADGRGWKEADGRDLILGEIRI